jgi:hypothetical protein
VRFEDFQRKPVNLDIPKEPEPLPTQIKKTVISLDNTRPSNPAPTSSSNKNDAFASSDPFASSSSSSANTKPAASTQKPKPQEVDFFASSAPVSTSAKNNNDFFAPAPTSTATQNKAPDFFSAPAASNDFFAPPSNSAPAATNKNVNQDFFAAPAPKNDDFFSTPSTQQKSTSSTSALDFHGLTFDVQPTPMQSQQNSSMQFIPPPQPPAGQVQQTTQQSNSAADPWGGLVDLNLGATDNKPQRRTSIQGSGPTLKQMTTTQPPAVSMGSPMQQNSGFGVTYMGGGNSFPAASPTNNTPFGGTSAPLDPFTNTSVPLMMQQQQYQQPMNPQGAISSMGNPFSQPSGGMNPNPFGGMGGGMNAAPYGASSNANPYAAGNPPYGGGYTPQGPPKQQQSSLDSLNWKM